MRTSRIRSGRSPAARTGCGPSGSAGTMTSVHASRVPVCAVTRTTDGNASYQGKPASASHRVASLAPKVSGERAAALASICSCTGSSSSPASSVSGRTGRRSSRRWRARAWTRVSRAVCACQGGSACGGCASVIPIARARVQSVNDGQGSGSAGHRGVEDAPALAAQRLVGLLHVRAGGRLGAVRVGPRGPAEDAVGVGRLREACGA